jgi:hypothetical protein
MKRKKMETNTNNPEIKTESTTDENRKEYVKPEVKKHKSLAVVSGSDCTYIMDSSYNYM